MLFPKRSSPRGFEEGVVVRDNWVYNHGHKGFNISGTWVTIKDNHNERDYLREGDDVYGVGSNWMLTLDGILRTSGGAGNISDHLSRAFDLGGQNVWVDGNFFNNVGSAPGNDGEGILCQAHGGTNLSSWGVTRNKHVKGTGQESYIGGWGVEVHGCLIAWNETAPSHLEGQRRQRPKSASSAKTPIIFSTTASPPCACRPSARRASCLARLRPSNCLAAPGSADRPGTPT